LVVQSRTDALVTTIYCVKTEEKHFLSCVPLTDGETGVCGNAVHFLSVFLLVLLLLLLPKALILTLNFMHNSVIFQDSGG
jgi:hypothetical protein